MQPHTGASEYAGRHNPANFRMSASSDFCCSLTVTPRSSNKVTCEVNIILSSLLWVLGVAQSVATRPHQLVPAQLLKEQRTRHIVLHYGSLQLCEFWPLCFQPFKTSAGTRQARVDDGNAEWRARGRPHALALSRAGSGALIRLRAARMYCQAQLHNT